MVKNQNIDTKLSIQDYILIFIVILLKMGFFIIVPLIRLIKTLQKDKWDDGTTQIKKTIRAKATIPYVFSLLCFRLAVIVPQKKYFAKQDCPDGHSNV